MRKHAANHVPGAKRPQSDPLLVRTEADSLGSRWCVVIGSSELERSVVQLKDLREHSQADVPRSEVVALIRARLEMAGRGGGA